MVTIRLARGGARKRPFYHLVATDSRKPRDSGHLERLGFFNPIAGGDEEQLRVDQERVRFWLDRGARTSERAAQLIRRHAQARPDETAAEAAPAKAAPAAETAPPAEAAEAAAEAPPAETAGTAAETASPAETAEATETAAETTPPAEATPAAD